MELKLLTLIRYSSGIVALILTLGWPTQGALAANRYVQVTKDDVNIRTEATTSSQIVGKAAKGDVFELKGETTRWFEIHMFSGDSRYIFKSLAAVVRFKPEAPEDEAVRRTVFREWSEIEGLAQQEADSKYSPGENLGRNISQLRLLEDRYKLELMQRFQLQPPVYRRIVIEGRLQGW